MCVLCGSDTGLININDLCLYKSLGYLSVHKSCSLQSHHSLLFLLLFLLN